MMRGCLRLVFGVAVLATLAVAAFLNRDRLDEVWRKARVEVPVLGSRDEALAAGTPELADRAEEKLAALASGDHARVSLTEPELQSLLRYRYAELLPAFIDSPRVEIDGSRLRLRGRLPVDKLPSVSEFGDLAALLPDTTDFAVTGQLLPLDSGRVALAVDEASAESIPLPRRLIAGALSRLGRTDEPGLPADALAVPLPPGAAAAYVRAGALVFLSRPAPDPHD
jgi:hypothetical protein